MTGHEDEHEEVAMTDVVIVGRLGWKRLLQIAALMDLVLLVLVAAVLGDREAAALAVMFAIGLGFLRLRKGVVGSLLLAVLSADVAFFTLTAAVSNIRAGEGVEAVATQGVLAAVSLAGLAGAVAVLLTRRRPGAAARGPALVVSGAVALLVALLVAGLVVRGGLGPAAADAVSLVTENTAFSEKELVV
jgi:hypothetical protein